MISLIEAYALRPVNMLQLIFVFGCAFSIALLWAKPRFSGLILLLGLEAILMVFNFSEETGIFAQQYLVTPVLSLATGPAFYLFIRHLVVSEHRWQWRDAAHFLPVLVALPFTGFTQAVLAVGSVSLVTYIVFCVGLLREYHQAAAQLLSDTVPVRLNWITGLMLAFAVLGLTDLVRLNLQPYLNYELRNVWYLLHQFAVFVLLMWMVSKALGQPELFDQLGFFEHYISAKVEQQTEAVDKALFAHIDSHVRQQQWYLQPKLSLNDLAQYLEIGIKDVSTAINQGAMCNFADYVNGLRVEAFKQALTSQTDSRPNMLQLALGVGFNSKSAFYDAFKRLQGQTPSQYWSSVNK